MRNVRSAVVVSCAMGILAATPAASQTFMGVVTDSTGHVIPGAEARIASMNGGRAIVAAHAGPEAHGTFRVTVPRARPGMTLYIFEVCAPGYAPQLHSAPMGLGDTLVVRAGLRKATSRVRPLGSGACAWELRGDKLTIVRGSGFALRAIATSDLVDSLVHAIPKDSTTAATMVHSVRGALLDSARAAPDAHTRARAAFVALQFTAMLGDSLTASERAELLHELPPDSPWWQSGPQMVPYVSTLFGVNLRDSSEATAPARRTARDYIRALAAARSDSDITAQARYEEAMYALGVHDTTTAKEMLRMLVATQPGYNAAVYATIRFRWLTPLHTGARMPPFSFTSLQGRQSTPITNADLTSPYTLVAFWGTWCGPCIGEIPLLDSLYSEHRAQGLAVMSVAADDSPAVVRSYIRAHHMPWRHAYAGTTEAPELKQLGILAFPTSVLIDSTGTIVGVARFSSELRSMVESAMAH